MLSPNYLTNIGDEIFASYADLHTAILSDVARRIAKTSHITATAEWQIQRLNEAGLLREEIINRIAKINGTTRGELRKLFREAAIKTRRYDERIYKAAGLEPIPIMQSPAMLQILDAGLNKTLGSIQNFTGTFAINAERTFLDASNLAYNKIASGAFSHQEAIKEAADELAQRGIMNFEYASGASISVEAGIRRMVLTGINQTAGEISRKSMIEIGTSLVRTSAHQGARTHPDEDFKDHSLWQGKWFHWKELELEIPQSRLIKFSGKYPDFVASCGIGNVQGIYGANCRHSAGGVIEGISPETYSGEDLDELTNQTVTYNGKEIPFYDATQMLRNMERNVRNWRRKADIKKGAGIVNTAERLKVKEWQHKAKDFTKQTGLTRQYIRERIAS